MAGDERTGVAIMRVTEGLDSGPVALHEAVPIEPTMTTARCRPRLAALGGELLPARSSCASAGELEFSEQDESATTYAAKIDPDRAPPRPGPPGGGAGAAVRALTRTSAPTSSSPAASGSASGPPRRRGRGAARPRANSTRDGDGCVLGCGAGAPARSSVVQPPGGPTDAGRRLPARPPAPQPAPRRVSAAAITGAPGRIRGAAADFRATAPGRIARSAAADAPRPRRPRSRPGPAARIRLGPAPGDQRHVDRRARRPVAGSLDPPVAAALRLGSVRAPLRRRRRRSRRRRPGGRAGEGGRREAPRRGCRRPGFVNAVLRRAAPRARRSCWSRSSDSTPQARGDRPFGTALDGRDVVAGAGRRGGALAAGGDRTSRPRRALRVNTPARRPRGGARARCARPASMLAGRRTGAARPGGRSSSTAASAGGDAALEAGELVPQSRGSRPRCELLGPQPGERMLDLCAGPGIKTAAIAARMGIAGELIAVESIRRAPSGGRAGLRPRSARAACRDRDRRRPSAWTSARSSIACSWTLPARTWGRSPRDPTPAGASPRRRSSAWRACRRRSSPGRLGAACAPAARSSTRPARSPGSENEAADRLLESDQALDELVVDDLGALSPQLASTTIARFLQMRPDRDRTDGFFFARLKGHD